MTNRQPKGTPVGGQFAEGRKPDALDLTPATTTKRGSWNLTIGEVDGEFTAEDSDLEHVAESVKNGYTSGELINERRGWWKLTITEIDEGFTAEDSDLEHIAESVESGFTSGQLVNETDLDDEPSESMLCTECGQSVGYDDSDTLQHLANGEWDFESDGDHAPMVSGANDDFVSSVSDEDKQRYVNAITSMYEEFASMGLEADTSRYLPNERGFQLLADSSLKITGELETSNGITWTAILKMGGKTISVENRGDGGSNWYTSDDGFGGWKLEEELNEFVTQGFPGLGPEAIDDFCSILEVAHEGDPK